jgi:hypothetical protein
MQYPKILFILKRREDYNADKHSHIGVSTGSYNSASFMNQMLLDVGIISKLVVVIDNNDIDREVFKFKPTHVIIEALWVVPTKFSVLCKLHPNVKWIIRLHSNIPFLAGEGMAFDWLGDYVTYKNVNIAVNSQRALKEVRYFIASKMKWDSEPVECRVIYLPNYYPQKLNVKKLDKSKDTIDIACFGAVRPMKNHLLQAMAAIEFADSIGKRLRFHINFGRVEMKGEPALRNLKSLFEHLHNIGHELIGHEWTHREEFLELCKTMDLGLQCSLSETFNIVGADFLSQGVPIVTSKEIPYVSGIYQTDAVSSKDICNKLKIAYAFPKFNLLINQYLLNRYTTNSRNIWIKYFKKDEPK